MVAQPPSFQPLLPITQNRKRNQEMKLTVNGELRDAAAATVFALLEELGLNPAATVVERNHEIVDRSAYRETRLAAGDVLELVRLVGGG